MALTLIAQQLKDDDLRELRETFIQLDKNRDGTLSHSPRKSDLKTRLACEVWRCCSDHNVNTRIIGIIIIMMITIIIIIVNCFDYYCFVIAIVIICILRS